MTQTHNHNHNAARQKDVSAISKDVASRPSSARSATSVAEQAHVLVVDDDKRLRDLLRQYLQGCGFGVSLACNAAEARQLLSTLRFDLVIVDILMPGESGLSLARSLQERESIPVLILSALGEPAERLQGLELGVADYMAKPFEPRELFLRVSKILSHERRRTLLPSRLKVGAWQFESRHDVLVSKERSVRLRPSEAKILRALASRAGAVVSRSALAHLSEIKDSPRAVDIAIAHLRQKLEANPKEPRHILTHRGKGYSLQLS